MPILLLIMLLLSLHRALEQDQEHDQEQESRTHALAPVKVEAVGPVALRPNGGPWMLPRSHAQAALVNRLNSMPHRLADKGFGVSTGQLVWNWHKDQLRAEYESGCYTRDRHPESAGTHFGQTGTPMWQLTNSQTHSREPFKRKVFEDPENLL